MDSREYTSARDTVGAGSARTVVDRVAAQSTHRTTTRNAVADR
jgi:hypothetical protein